MTTADNLDWYNVALVLRQWDEARTAHTAGLSAEVIATSMGRTVPTARIILGCDEHDCD